MPRPPRIFLEATHTYYNGHNTGIQRVVRNIALHAPTVGKDLQIECSPVAWSLYGFIRVSSLPTTGKPAFKLIKSFTRWTYQTLTGKKKKEAETRNQENEKQKTENNPAHFTPDSRYPMPDTRTTPNAKRPTPNANDRRSPALLFLRRLAYLSASALCHSPLAIFTRRVRLQKGDILILLDASWNQPMWSAVRRARRRGCKIGLVVYDVIAVTNPEWFDRPLALSFQDWFQTALQEVQFYLGISEATRAEVAGLAAGTLPPLPKALPSGSFQLGAEPAGVGSNEGQNEVKTGSKLGVNVAFNSEKVCLTVATIEPRKNHAILLDAFDLLISQGFAISLVFIGRPGWECSQIINRIENHPLFNQKLFWFQNADDADLDYAYRHAHTLVLPSLAEGFGLPIIESLTQGLPVLCSDIPVFREVGQNFCTYFPLGSPQALAQAIRQALESPRQISPGFSWPGWRESCQQLLQKSQALAAQIPRETGPL